MSTILLNQPTQLLAICIALLAFTSGCGLTENDPSLVDERNSINIKIDDTKVISYSGAWSKAVFPNEYHHSVDIMIPATWGFNSGNDTDSYSAYWIIPPVSDSDPDIDPVITVFDFALIGCPDDKVNDCSIDEVQAVTTDRYMNYLIQQIERRGEIAYYDEVKQTGKITLNNFNTEALIYSGKDPVGQPADIYLIEFSHGVVSVVFSQPAQFDKNFTTTFLNKLIPNSSSVLP